MRVQDNSAPRNDSETEALRAELEATQKAFQDFIYIVSHDLNTPLRAVVNFSRLLEDKYSDKLDEKALRYLGFICDGGNKAQAMLNGLLDLSRLTTRPRPYEKVSTRKMVEQAISALQDNIRENRAVIETAVPLPDLVGDPDQLAMLWMCLLDNALKFHTAESNPRIRISAEKLATEWVFSVADNGIGIDGKYNDRIFNLFQRLHTDSEYPGIGMGLTLARKIVDRHGGRLWLESQPGNGTTFYFSIPFTPR